MSSAIWLSGPPIPVSFATHGYTFYRGGTGVLGTPKEAFLRLVAVRGDEKVELPSVADLRSRVTIADAAEAVDFVRLFTSLDTHYLFPDVGLIEPVLAHGAPRAGEYTADYARRIGLQPPNAYAGGGGFVIERNVLDSAGRLVRANERVGADGSYAFVRTAIVDQKPSIAYPRYQ